MKVESSGIDISFDVYNIRHVAAKMNLLASPCVIHRKAIDRLRQDSL